MDFIEIRKKEKWERKEALVPLIRDYRRHRRWRRKEVVVSRRFVSL